MSEFDQVSKYIDRQIGAYDRPAYLTTDLDAIEKRCKRCNHLLLLDYGRRAEIVHEKIVVHIITSDYAGRCTGCLSWFDWHPKKRKS